MSADLERLANGVLWPGFFGTRAPEWLLHELRQGLAGVVYFGQNVGEGLAALSDEIRQANPDALIGVDEEGGSVTRLESATGSTVPGAAQLGLLDDLVATETTGAELARRVRAVGANVVLGPVADVNTDPRNPVIGVRAFGADEALVSRHVVASVDGIQDAGAAACVKHFPGHGDTHLDSHHALPEISLDIEEFERVHLEPFRAAVAAGVDAVMTAHIVVPAWGEAPATLNPRVLGMLRQWGFDGVIVTDALDMAAIRETVGIGGGAALALAAGADLLCIGNPTNPGDDALADQDLQDFLAARDGIVTALRDGSLSRERVEEAAARVAALAAKLHEAADRDQETDDEYDAGAIVRRAISIVGTAPASASELAVIDARRRSSLAVDSAAGYVSGGLAADGPRVRLDVASTPVAEQDEVLDRVAAGPGTTVLLIDRPDADAAQRALVERAALKDAGAVVVNVGLPAKHPLPLPTMEVAAASLVGAQVAREQLLGRFAPPESTRTAG
ncbi:MULTISPECIES: glycoside hydrolase family 3 N-terminal domain-containing protein [unclassified Microbacterium]|uniref:glycoside hydrolase family 3 N-terminal domain-containing protein n=1 Tax=unclassified Microbacterium TaxID=2609290 RepID=UPI000EAA32F0|nr:MULTISPECIES: glycoside hydrolase family 3 N-terminal domain-containing protein [unclassified Microbacterium]MBT2484943.1 glycoside hydrolase family 3 protein [Microbacterium sp. ISL-108]RKN67803.1 glycoside hydrolase family 3 protein [Microbacterium sp. CGR2]